MWAWPEPKARGAPAECLPSARSVPTRPVPGSHCEGRHLGRDLPGWKRTAAFAHSPRGPVLPRPLSGSCQRRVRSAGPRGGLSSWERRGRMVPGRAVPGPGGSETPACGRISLGVPARKAGREVRGSPREGSGCEACGDLGRRTVSPEAPWEGASHPRRVARTTAVPLGTPAPMIRSRFRQLEVGMRHGLCGRSDLAVQPVSQRIQVGRWPCAGMVAECPAGSHPPPEDRLLLPDLG